MDMDVTTKQSGGKPSVSWEGCASTEEWLKTQSTNGWKEFFEENGYLVVKDVINPKEVEKYREIYRKFITREINAYVRHDLGNHEETKVADKENICQIMYPLKFLDGLDQGPLHQRVVAISKIIQGDDMELHFDNLIYKAPHTDTPTPWHQDVSYWYDFPDKRSAVGWCPLDDVNVDNGCMWFVPGSYKKPPRPHRPMVPGKHVLVCDCTEEEGVPQPIPAGSVTFHHGQTLHYTRGNSTSKERRAIGCVMRPKDMIELDLKINKERGVDRMNTKNWVGKTKIHRQLNQTSD